MALRLITRAKHRRVRRQRIRLKPTATLSLGCPATGVAGAPLLFQGRLRAPGARRARVLRAHFENEATGAAMDQDVRAAKSGTFALMAPLPTDGPWSVTLAWTGDRSVLGRAVNCRVVLRGPPRVQISRPGDGAVVVADSDLALEGAASDTVDGKLAVAWAIDGAPAGSGPALTTRIHRARPSRRHAHRHQRRGDLRVGDDRRRGHAGRRPSRRSRSPRPRTAPTCQRARRSSRLRRATRTTDRSRAP